MNVELNKLTDHLGRPLLCVVHTDRPMQEPRNDINYLERRFDSALRLPPAQPFETLEPSSAFSPYLGTITVYNIGETGERPPELVCAFKPGTYKPSHAMWHNDRLWVLGGEHIEVYDAHLNSLKVIRDPWLAGTHTIAPDDHGRVLVSCSASDAILAFDAGTGDLSQFWRVPEDRYGRNYSLDRAHSVVDHYIDNDRQLTHINCGWPWRGGLLVSLLIQGAIGWSDGNGGYRELVRGFVGCHGARVRSDIEEIYFADSCSGMLVFLDPHGVIIRRVGTGSRWLHDAVQIGGDLFAVAPFDFNEVVLLNVATRQVAWRIPCAAHGGPHSLSFGGPRAAAAGSAQGRTDDAMPAPALDHAGLRRQHAAMIRARDEFLRDHAERIRSLEETIADLRAERNTAVTARDAIIAQMDAARAREVCLRDEMLAELETARRREVSARDTIIAELHAQQAREVATRDTTIAELGAREARQVGARDERLKALEAINDELRRDLAFATRGWRQWIIGRRRTTS